MPIPDPGYTGVLHFLAGLEFPTEELEEVVWTELS